MNGESKEENELCGRNILRAIKYSVPSRGEIGKGIIWRIYMDIESGHEQTAYVDHIDFLTPGYVGNNAYRIGFSYLCKGCVTFDYNPETKLRYAVIHSGDYVPKYILKNDKWVENE